MYWSFPLIMSLFLALLLAALHYWYTRHYAIFHGNYDRQLEALIVKLERVTIMVNRMAMVVEHIKDDRLLAYYESCLRLLENLLTAVKEVPTDKQDIATLRSASYLARECNKRVGRTQKAFTQYLKGKSIDIASLYGRVSAKFPVGCYFCSRPYDPRGFRKVKVKVDEKTLSVHGCAVCRQELSRSKKVKVLYFMRDEQQVHWSELPDYTPSRDFYDINRGKRYGQASLRLIYSRQSDD